MSQFDRFNGGIVPPVAFRQRSVEGAHRALDLFAVAGGVHGLLLNGSGGGRAPPANRAKSMPGYPNRTVIEFSFLRAFGTNEVRRAAGQARWRRVPAFFGDLRRRRIVA